MDFLVKYGDYIIAIFTTIFTVAGMQFRNMKVILISQLIANSLLAAQCILGGTASAGAIVFLSIAQTVVSFVFNAYGKRFPVPLTVAFMAGFTAITIIYFTTPFDILTLVAAWFFAICIVQEHSYICRFCALANTCLWLIYDAFVMPSGLINHTVVGILIFATIIRLDRDESKRFYARFKKVESSTEENAEQTNS